MKRSYILASIFLVFLISCTKQSDDARYYLKLKINDSWLTWQGTAGLAYINRCAPAFMDLSIQGSDENHKDLFELRINVYDKTINPGVYTSDNSTYMVVVDYYKDLNTVNQQFFFNNDAPALSTSKFTVNLISITENEVAGNFKGNYLFDKYTGELLSLTEGQFWLPRTK